MTFDTNKIVDEVGASWRQSPFSMIFGVVMFAALLAAFLMVYSVLAWVQEIVDAENQRAAETRNEIAEFVKGIDDALTTFEERQKLFRDEIRDRIAQTEVEQEQREAEFWDRIEGQFDTLNTQHQEILDQRGISHAGP